MPEIELDRAAYCYKDQNGRFWALEDISLHIGQGEFLCIVGPSGCGKTTLLRLIAGLQLPTGGAVKIGGRPVEGPGTDRAMVFQSYPLFPWMTAAKNVQFAVRQAKKDISRARAREIADDFLRRVDMAHAAGKYPYQLSGGMRQRVAIARALAMDGDILLLDEPFGALDASIRAELQGLLEEMWRAQKHKTVVFVTHDVQEALYLADRILFMQPGKVAAEIPVELPRPRRILDPKGAARLSLLHKQLMVMFSRAAETEGTLEA